MAPHGHHLEILTFIFLWLIYSPVNHGAENTSRQGNISNVTDVKVGVILDTSSPDGGISWSCMQLALEDIYEEHPNYSTRTSLVLRDLKNEPQDGAFGAAVAAVDLLNNVQVHAIIGPQTATQAKFLIALGNKSNVPVISFSAKCPSTSFSQTPYFFRTSWNDSSQAIVIASIAQKFSWREIVPVFEDTDSGNIFVPYLVDTLQEVDAHVPYRCKIPSMASESEIDSALNYLNANRTRVFVVHMSYNLSLKFFSRAKEKNMMGTDEFVWITTYDLTDIVDLFGSYASDKMQGVLGIRPLVPYTTRVQSVSKRLRKKYQVNGEPPAFCLWAYDTAWLLAESVEHVKDRNLSFKASNAPHNSTDFSKIGVSEMGSMLKASLESANFSGISGDFRLVNGQLQSGPFVITNVDGANNAPVGNWSRGNISINWPGRSRTAPKGWQWPITGEYLRIGVPSSGFKIFVNWSKHEPNNNSPGYCIEVFEDVMKQLPYNVPYQFEEYGDGDPDKDYDDLVYQVYLKNYDAVIGDITILANRSLYVDFTLPYIESGVRMVVPVKDVNTKTPWAFLEPWTAKLWLTTGAFFLLTGITVWFIEHRVNKEFRGGPVDQLGSTFYFAFSTLVFAHRERLVSNLSRLVVIIWVFVVLILQQSYTASLTSKLTVEQLQATVTSIDQVIKANQKVGYLNYSFVKGLLQRLGLRESNIVALSSPDEYYSALSNGTVAAVVDEIPYLKVFLGKYSNNYAMVGPTYKSEGFGFAFPRGSPLVQDVSRAILKVMESNMTKYDEEIYGNIPFTDKESQEVQTSLTFHSFVGLFLLTGASSILALTIHMLFAICKQHNSPINIEAALDRVEKDEPRTEDQSNDHSMNFCDYVLVDISPDSRSIFEEIISPDRTPVREISLTNLGE